MKKVFVALATTLMMFASNVDAASFQEPKDSFILDQWQVYHALVTMIQSESKPRITHHPVAIRRISKPKVPTIRVVQQKPTVAVSQWYSAIASEYGGSDGFYYGHLACGGKYYPNVMGVAHKTLPCGTMVTLRYHGYTVTVPVVDRGPYVAGRSFDLTIATANALHFGGLGQVYWRISK